MVLRPSKAGILAALSVALDLVEGQPEGHAIRTARIAWRLGRDAGLDEAAAEDLVYAALIKDSGCSNNSARVQKIFGGDEILTKRLVKFVDWSNPLDSLKFAVGQTERGRGLAAKLRRMAANVGTPTAVMNEVTEARCTRGAEIARRLHLSSDVADAVRYLDEHWDGKGAPYGRRRREIPTAARILCLAQTVEVFASTFGPAAAAEMARARAGRWFDPDFAALVPALAADAAFWEEQGRTAFEGSDLPIEAGCAPDADIDAICEAFALIVDAKSSFTAEHSARVARYAVAIARRLGLPADTVKTLHRAGLLHDVGKLGVPSSILEKPAKLDADEFARVQRHPQDSYRVLSRIPTFEAIADLASAHHERLDGRGYWRGLAGDQIPLEARVLTAADVWDALTADRPYRAGMAPAEAWAIMERDRGTAFDPRCLDALRELYLAAPLPAAA